MNDLSLPPAESVQITQVDPTVMLNETVRSQLTAEAVDILARIDDENVKKEILLKGSKIQGTGVRNTDLLRGTFKSLMESNPMRDELESNMHKVLDASDKLTPERMGKLGMLTRIFTRNPVMAQLRKMARGYESAEAYLTTIEGALTKGAGYLSKDSTELLNVYTDLATQQRALAEYTFSVDCIFRGLLEKKNDPTYEPDKIFEHNIVMNLQDCKMRLMANKQFMVTIDMAVNGNTTLSEHVKRTAGVVGTVSRTGMIIQAALLRQKNIVDLVQETKKDMSDRMVANAKLIEANTSVIAEVSSSPVLALDKVRESFQILQKTARDLEVVRDKTSKDALAALSEIDRTIEGLNALPGARQLIASPPSAPAPREVAH